MQMISANGIRLHVRLLGRDDGPALVFANSLGTDSRVWDAVADRLKGDFRLILYDKRGHGLSEAPPAPYSLDDHVADLAGLLDALDPGPVILCGVSVGGMIAQGLSAVSPGRVRSLVLCDTAHRIGPPDMWDQRITAIRGGGIEALADPIMERWFSADFHAKRAAELAGWRHMLVRTPLEGYLGTCAAIRDADLTEAARSIAVPTLCLCGSEDGATTPALVRSLADLIPGARFELIDSAGHLPGAEAPDAVVSLMQGFFREHDLG